MEEITASWIKVTDARKFLCVMAINLLCQEFHFDQINEALIRSRFDVHGTPSKNWDVPGTSRTSRKSYRPNMSSI